MRLFLITVKEAMLEKIYGKSSKMNFKDSRTVFMVLWINLKLKRQILLNNRKGEKERCRKQIKEEENMISKDKKEKERDNKSYKSRNSRRRKGNKRRRLKWKRKEKLKKKESKN